MTLAQLHYTSAPPGSDGSGFRFTAVSAEVPQEVLREAEQLIGYEPPHDLPAQPDAEQLKRFPKAFTFSELADGGRLLSRSVYTGADSGGRWGAFHAHAVHLPPGTRLPDGALPITAWESRRWAETAPPDGRPVPIDRFEPSGLLRRDSLIAFAVSRSDRLAAFFTDLRALTEGLDPATRIVLVEHDSADVAQWIALACAVLPREQAHRLTFTTYTRRPQQARQQIIGALPSSDPVAHDHRYRVHDCTTAPAPESATRPGTDAWAQICAHIWCAGRPDLFRDTSAETGPLAVAALVAGIELGAAGRTAAARWAVDHVGTLADDTLTALVGALCEGGEPRAAGRTGGGPGLHDSESSAPGDAEQAALAALLTRLEGRVPTVVTAPLAARVLAAAVRDRGPMPVLRAGSLTAQAQAALARELAPALRAGIADERDPAAGRPLALLRVADLLDIDCQDLLPELAGRLARELVAEPLAGVEASAGKDAGGYRATDPAGCGERPSPADRPITAAAGNPPAQSPSPSPALLEAVHEHPALRIALFGALDTLAASDPAGAARRLAGSGLPIELQSGFPHVRMCLMAGECGGGAGGDRLGRFHGVLRTAGVSPHADTAVLRTALDLVWSGDLPTGQEASLLLNQLGSDIHRAAGTRDILIDAALAAPPDDHDVPALAADLLRCFPTELRPGQRAALLLLEFAGLLGTEGEGEDWVGRALELRDATAAPVAETVMERVFDALARRLVLGPGPESELYTLARTADPGLLAAYERVGRSDRVGDRLRTVPSYVADCFSSWSSFAGTRPEWDETRTALLTKVLRPIVRALPAKDVAAVEEALGRAGRGRLDAFRSWNRPGALGRLAGRLSGRGRRGTDHPPV
ncbi:GTPase-associated protein 1-related protein [Streptomyces sp. NPDC051243]|uniref:GTPase-associated protein 1-related protein n=1 Tax=Streptomyces sp. NPDC051243 TaxID=3365646 RepID=UPI00379E16E0